MMVHRLGRSSATLDDRRVERLAMYYVYYWAGALLLGALLLLWIGQGNSRTYGPPLMIGSALGRLAIARVVGATTLLGWLVGIELVTLTAIAITIPDSWALVVLLLVATSTWWHVTGRSLIGSVLAAVVVLAFLGFVRSPDAWLSTILVALIVIGFDRLVYPLVMLRETDHEQTLANALAASAAIVHVGDLATGRTLSVQGPVEAITSYTPEEWCALDLRSILHPDDVDDFWITDVPPPGTAIDRRARIRTKDGRWVWIRDVASITREAEGSSYIRGFAIDITEIEMAHAVIRRQAETDELTGLANRTRFSEEVAERLARGEPLTIMMMDLDRFKSINDALGHSFGDGVLVELASRLRRTLPDGDLVARLGGDEFAVVAASATDESTALDLASTIAIETARPMSVDGISISASASIGVVLAPRDGVDTQTLMRHADIAMYEAKQHSATHVLFDSRIEQAPLEDVMLTASLRLAIEDRQLELHYQPIVRLETGEVVGFEALARWEHPTLGMLLPERFIHLLTVSDQSQGFADYTVASAIEFAVKCQGVGRAVPVSVNLSTRSLFDETLPDRVAGHLDDHSLDPAYLVIEITEADIMDPVGPPSRILSRLAGLGVSISIDDFGTGYSSLARLVDLPISEIKIDRRFVSLRPDREPNESIVRSIIDLGHRLDLHVVAEGVEDQEAVDLLLDAGCGEAQGFFLARPAPTAAALKLLI